MENNNDMQAKVIALVFLAIFLVAVWSMLDIVLLTFIFTFLFYNLLKQIRRGINDKFNYILPYKPMVFLAYFSFVLVIVYASYKLTPIIFNEISDIFNMVTSFNIENMQSELNPIIANILANMNLESYLSKLATLTANIASTITSFTLIFVMAFLLSFLIMMEQEEIARFSKFMEYSKMDFIYKYIKDFGGSFVDTFGQVMWVQLIIATINSIVSMLMLKLLGFNSILGLGLMIFLLGLVPVAGVIISVIPLSIIGYNIGGITKVIEVIVMVVCVHALESYVLNPKLMSNRTKLPVCMIFIILLIGEHYLGMWGLLISVPIFMFVVERLNISYEDMENPDFCLDEKCRKEVRKRNRLRKFKK